MTLPARTVALVCWVIVPIVKPMPWMIAIAVFWGCPTTSGTGTVVGWLVPEETTRSTAAPGAARTPARGLWLMTVPAGMVALNCWVTAPMVKPAVWIVAMAALWVWLTTSGTGISAGEFGPVETTMLIDGEYRGGGEAFGNIKTPGGTLWLMTLPAGTVALAS